MKFGTILADPPWAYGATSRQKHDSSQCKKEECKICKLSGYTDVIYPSLSTDALCALPVGEYADEKSVLLLWTTFPFLPDALRVIEAWGFKYVTGLPWVKVTGTDRFALQYGVGYWFRGAAELLLVGKRKKAYRTNHTGILAPGMKHSRKPDGVYALVETGDAPFPVPYLELFARHSRDGWTQLGDAIPGCEGEDIAVSLKKLGEIK